MYDALLDRILVAGFLIMIGLVNLYAYLRLKSFEGAADHAPRGKYTLRVVRLLRASCVVFAGVWLLLGVLILLDFLPDF